MATAPLQSRSDAFVRTQWAMAGALVLLLGGLYLFGYRPAAGRLAALQRETHERETELAAAQLRARDLKSVELQVERLKSRLERFDKRLPNITELGQEAAGFIGEINQLSQRGSLRNVTYKQGVLKRSMHFSELPYSLNFQGDFVQAAGFLQQAEMMPRLARVQKLTMRSKDLKQGQVDVEVSMNIYFADNH